MIIPAGLFALALFLLVKGVKLLRQERLLVGRLVETRGRVTDRGDVASYSTFTMSDGTERQDTSYEGKYEYRVGDLRYAGTVTSTSPVFTADQMPPNEITIFYDSESPSVSRLNAVPATTGRDYVRFAALVFAVAVAIVAVALLGR